MNIQRRTVLIVGLVLTTVISFASEAFATGLVVYDDSGTPTSLGLLADLSVDVVLSDGSAHITETREYVIEADGVGRTAAFYRTLGDSVDAESVRVWASDAEIATTLDEEESARIRQIDLVGTLGEPGVLRGLGSRLARSELLPVTEHAWSTIVVRLEYREALEAWDTMRGVSIPIDWQEEAVRSMQVTVAAHTGEPLRALYSPFHGLDVTRVGATGATATYHGSEVCTTNDLVLLLSTGADDIQLDLLPFRYGDADGGFFMALVTPSVSAEALPRDIVFVLDTSGSMEGEKMQQARDALHGVLAGLSSKDRFTIVEFDGNVTVLSEDARAASTAFVSEADDFVTDLVADGATNLSDALGAGFDALPFSSERPRYIVLLTDGQPTEGITDTDAILDLVRLRNEVGARLFAFGIGNDVNTVLLDRLAVDSSGDAIYVRPGESVVGPVEEFFAGIASAALVDPSFESSAFGGGLTSMYPERLPDLYANQTVALFGRYAAGGRGEIVLRGMRGSDVVEKRYDVELPDYSVQNGHVPRIWATRHIGTLLHRIKLGETDPALADEATAVAARFGVVTEFTNFVLDENGNAVMKYTDVPLDATGSVAVDTSSSLDGYQNTGSAATAFDDFVRYVGDRTLPIHSGWFTDTSAGMPRDWAELHFGSERYLALVAGARSSGVERLMAVARDVAFEWHGQYLRVSDTESDRDLPVEDAVVALPEAPVATPATVRVVVESRRPADESGSDGRASDDDDDPPSTDSDVVGTTDDDHSLGEGCNVAQARPGGLPLLLLLLGGVFNRRGRRRR